MSTSTCSCGKPRAKKWHLACPECWALVPKIQQDEVYRLFKTQRGKPAHVEAVRACFISIHEARKKADSTPAVKKPKSAILVKCRMGSGATWVARTKMATPPRKAVSASCTSGAERAARRVAAKALRCEEGDVSLIVDVESRWDRPGSYFAHRIVAPSTPSES